MKKTAGCDVSMRPDQPNSVSQIGTFVMREATTHSPLTGTSSQADGYAISMKCGLALVTSLKPGIESM